MIYLRLFLSFLQIGAFSFGGGYAAMRLIQEQVVYTNHWLTAEQFNNLITISQMTPGPIAINSATFVGLRIAGIGGAIVATLGCILPSCIIVLILALVYFKYRNLSVMQSILAFLRPAVVSMIAASGLSIIMSSFFGSEKFPIDFSQTQIVAIVIFAVSVFLLKKVKLNPVYVMLIAGLMQLSCTYALKIIL